MDKPIHNPIKNTRIFSQRLLINSFSLLIFMIIITINIGSYYQMSKFATANQRVNHTHEVIQSTNNLLLNILEIESVTRGYLITGDKIFIKNIDKKINNLHYHLTITKYLIQNINQQDKITDLEQLINKRLQFIQQVIFLKKNHKLQTAKELSLLVYKAQNLSEEIKATILNINDIEFKLLKERDENVLHNLHQLSFLIISASAITLFIVFLGLITFNRQLSQQIEAEKVIQLANKKLKLAYQKLKEHKDKLQTQSIRDPLTKLYNRAYLNESLEREINRAERNNIMLAIIMLDLDHFKNVNDTLGHQAGDLILQTIGKLLLKQVRKSDIACRYGGEEFLLMLYDTSLEDAIKRTEYIRKAISHLKFHFSQEFHFSEEAVNSITASFGIAIYPLHSKHINTLIKAADQALYISKETGRNKVTVYK